MSALIRLLDDRRTTTLLVAANVLVALGVAVAFRANAGNDLYTYVGLAEGILHGMYSFWWELGPSFPDTFRTPGYPLLLAAAIELTGTWRSVQILQFLLYLLAMYFSMRTVDNLTTGRKAKNLFLILLLPSINIPFYVPAIFPEIPTLAGMAFVVWVWSEPRRTLTQAIGLGLVYVFIFLCRPVFLLFPLILLVYEALFARERVALGFAILPVLLLALGTLPYGMWNRNHHGVFSITPLEGGAGVMHTGYWAGRLPNYMERRYWGNRMGDELPRFVPESDLAEEIVAFNAEWDVIDAQLDPLLTANDSLMLAEQANRQGLFRTYNARYTIERERLLKEITLRNMAEEPGYVLRYKSYSALRSWVIGIMRHDAENAKGMKAWLALLYPTALTLAQFLLAVIIIPYVLIVLPEWRKRLAPMVLLLGYYTLIHVPFVIQVRYTTSVRMTFLLVIAISMAALLERRRDGTVQGKVT